MIQKNTRLRQRQFWNRDSSNIHTGVLLFGIILLAFWIRIQGIGDIPTGYFTSNDAYLYKWQAQIISEDGALPARDMHRWLPLGRDNQQLLFLYAYAIVYTHKTIGWLFPKLIHNHE